MPETDQTREQLAAELEKTPAADFPTIREGELIWWPSNESLEIRRDIAQDEEDPLPVNLPAEILLGRVVQIIVPAPASVLSHVPPASLAVEILARIVPTTEDEDGAIVVWLNPAEPPAELVHIELENNPAFPILPARRVIGYPRRGGGIAREPQVPLGPALEIDRRPR